VGVPILTEPKFSPEIVTEAPPDTGDWENEDVKTGVSNVNAATLVPTLAETVSRICLFTAEFVYELGPQRTIVLVVQVVVVHCSSSIWTVGVRL